jgi:hypothetical protein
MPVSVAAVGADGSDDERRCVLQRAHVPMGSLLVAAGRYTAAVGYEKQNTYDT